MYEWGQWEAKAKTMTKDQLLYSIYDCIDAADAMKGHDPVKEGRYRDEASVYRTELNKR